MQHLEQFFVVICECSSPDIAKNRLMNLCSLEPACRVGRQIVNVPSFMVRVESEKHIDFSLSSPFGGGPPGRVKRKNQKKASGGGGDGGDEDEE